MPVRSGRPAQRHILGHHPRARRRPLGRHAHRSRPRAREQAVPGPRELEGREVLATALEVNDVVMALDPMLRRLLREDMTLELRLSPTGGTVAADQGQLEQVLLNLLVNARDAMPDGGRVIINTSVVAAEGSPARRTIRVTCPSDTRARRERHQPWDDA